MKIFFLLILFFLTNCTLSGTAFLGPVFTGAKTGSIYQASLSYGTNQVLNQLKTYESKKTNKEIETTTINESTENRNPPKLESFVVAKVEISEVLEPEPLP